MRKLLGLHSSVYILTLRTYKANVVVEFPEGKDERIRATVKRGNRLGVGSGPLCSSTIERAM